MITDIFLSITIFLLHSFVELLPVSSGFPPEFAQAFYTYGSYTSILDPIVSWSTLAFCVSLIFGLEIAVFGFNLLAGFYRLFFKR